MKIRREESKEGPVDSVSDILLDRFQGVKVCTLHCGINPCTLASQAIRISEITWLTFINIQGKMFRETCANFLKNQGYALDMLRDKKKKDPKLAKFLQEKEEDQRCRRLQFKVHMYTEEPRY